MIEKYQRLFQLDVFHSYFQKDICRCLEFNAEPATEQLMKRFRFLIRKQINGIGFYVKGGQSTEALLSYIENATGQDSFCFQIRSNNPDFNFFTELPPNWVGQLLYDSNNITVLDQQVNLNQELSGNAGTLCMGKVTLRFADILKFSDQTGFANFEIKYQARATQWQYFVINRSSVSFEGLSISGKQNIDFDGPEQVQTAAGEAALLFSSGNNFIPLSEAALYRFDLMNLPLSADGTALAPQIIIKGLPTPIPEWIGQVMDKTNEHLSSPMYVYL